jgi:hypothetical protein
MPIPGAHGQRRDQHEHDTWHFAAASGELGQARWRMVNAPHLVARVRAGDRFVNGKLVK